MTRTEMRDMLAAREIQLTKSLGQNFLHDKNQLRRIVEAAELTKSDKVLEIGPGLGPLTELLVERAGQVLAIEKDARLVELLREKFRPLTPTLSPLGGERERTAASNASVTPSPPDEGRRRGPGRGGAHKDSPLCGSPPTRSSRGESEPSAASVEAYHPQAPGQGLELLHDDALDFIRRERRDWTNWKVVANLPYSVASPILVELARSARRPERMVVTLQLEVAQRLMAGADDSDYGVLTLLVQLDYEARGSFKIPADCFFPVPGVDSACVTLMRRSQPLLPDELRTTFVKIVKRAFSQRRKMMMKLLKQDWSQEKLVNSFRELNISSQERAEKLSLEQFVAMTRMLCR